MELGKTNKLRAARTTTFGYFLEDKDGNEVLLPNAYVPDTLNVNDEIEVFVYRDNEERLISTTLRPKLELEEFAFLEVKQVNKAGAFADWGLVKQLMVPFSEQMVKMEEGKSYVMYLHLDEETDRLIGSAKIHDFLFFEDITVEEGEEVDLLFYKQTDLGLNAIVNGMFQGLVFQSDVHKRIKIGDQAKGYVKQVREDGRIDLLLEPMGYRNVIDSTSQLIIDALKKNNGFISLTDKSSPDAIKDQLGLSKKAFKKALGNLYKKKMVSLEKDGTKLL
jgi:predicted RNA-binding protein (virulence factor B family)